MYKKYMRVRKKKTSHHTKLAYPIRSSARVYHRLNSHYNNPRYFIWYRQIFSHTNQVVNSNPRCYFIWYRQIISLKTQVVVSGDLLFDFNLNNYAIFNICIRATNITVQWPDKIYLHTAIPLIADVAAFGVLGGVLLVSRGDVLRLSPARTDFANILAADPVAWRVFSSVLVLNALTFCCRASNSNCIAHVGQQGLPAHHAVVRTKHVVGHCRREASLCMAPESQKPRFAYPEKPICIINK